MYGKIKIDLNKDDGWNGTYEIRHSSFGPVAVAVKCVEYWYGPETQKALALKLAEVVKEFFEIEGDCEVKCEQVD